MSETKHKIKYDYDFLKQYCEENGIELLKEYSLEKVTRETIIEAKCLTKGCQDICSKTFRRLVESSGCYCINCAVSLGKEKGKKTCLEKYGVENPQQNKEVKEKGKKTCLEKYGVENPFQNKEIQKKSKQVCLEKYGVEHISRSQQFKDKFKATCLEKYGVEHILQSQQFKDKFKATCLEKYGVESPQQNKEIREKSKKTSLQNWGVENPSQNAEVSEKASKNAYKSYDYIFTSGRIERIQGYERYLLDDLLQKEEVKEDDIIIKRNEVPSVWYEDTNGKKHRYFVDCFIKSQNRCIEVKSTWTAEKKKDCIYLKQQALKGAGYKCEIWIYDGKGEIVEKVL